MKTIFLGIIFVQIVSTQVLCQSKTYYISPGGNDNNKGLSVRGAWKSIEKVNSYVFQPGDAVLFESGGLWYGQLRPQGDGSKDNPIILSYYGKGPKPVINIGEMAGTGIKLVNQSWWIIQGIEVTSGAAPMPEVKREAISVTVEKDKKTEGIIIRDCYIHDIWGQVGGFATSRMIDVGPVAMRDHDAVNNIIVENNIIKRCDKVGIVVNGRNNIVVRGNYMENLGGDGIIVGGAYRGLIERNVAHETCLRTGDPFINSGKVSRYSWWPHTAAIWLIWCEETVMQYNEVYNTGRQAGNGDGMAYDFDFGCKNCILQYNYSRNNAGFLLIMDNTSKNITRYNISENDVHFRPTHLVSMFCDTTEQNIIHNNVFYVDHGTADIDCYYGDEYGPNKGKGKKDKGKLGAYFRNNIFYATGQGRFRNVYSLGDSLNSAEYRRLEDFHKLPQGNKFLNNCYFGPWHNGFPEDSGKLLADPMFVSPGTGAKGLGSLAGYKLKAESPCIDKGIKLNDDTVRDFFGNHLSDGLPDLGVYEALLK